MITIPTPHRCAVCRAPVARERVTVQVAEDHLAFKRRYLNADGELHQCPPPANTDVRRRRLARLKRDVHATAALLAQDDDRDLVPEQDLGDGWGVEPK